MKWLHDHEQPRRPRPHPRTSGPGRGDRPQPGTRQWVATPIRKAEDGLDNPRALALPDWATLTQLADALVARSADHYRGWGDVVLFAACTGARIGEISCCRVADINIESWLWTVRRQTTPSPGGLMDKGTKGKRARSVPLIIEIRDMIQRCITATDGQPDARLFTGSRGGRITTAVLRDATQWDDDVVTSLGYEPRPATHRPDLNG